uniref:Uncharacterized protein n=1 Tax=Zea mays TaxID=4577 RepID=A0A804UAR4_MAIZE
MPPAPPSPSLEGALAGGFPCSGGWINGRVDVLLLAPRLSTPSIALALASPQSTVPISADSAAADPEEDEAGRGAWRLGEEQPRRVVVVLSFHFHASQYTEKTTSEREFVISFSSAPLPGLSCCLSSPRLTLVGCWQYTAALSGLHLRCTYAGRGGEKRTTLLLVILMESAAE